MANKRMGLCASCFGKVNCESDENFKRENGLFHFVCFRQPPLLHFQLHFLSIMLSLSLLVLFVPFKNINTLNGMRQCDFVSCWTMMNEKRNIMSWASVCVRVYGCKRKYQFSLCERQIKRWTMKNCLPPSHSAMQHDSNKKKMCDVKIFIYSAYFHWNDWIGKIQWSIHECEIFGVCLHWIGMVLDWIDLLVIWVDVCMRCYVSFFYRIFFHFFCWK